MIYDPSFDRIADANTDDALHDLAASTMALYGRFDFVPTINDAVAIFAEEANELIFATREEPVDPKHIAEEAADVFVTAMGLCFAAGVELDKLVEQIYFVINKNDAKTDKTHELRDGKIRRKVATNA